MIYINLLLNMSDNLINFYLFLFFYEAGTFIFLNAHARLLHPHPHPRLLLAYCSEKTEGEGYREKQIVT